jgi:tetratricopeptide (TPR) repeat protein
MKNKFMLPLLMLLAARGAFSQTQADEIVAFKNVNLIPMTSAKVVPQQTVLIKGGKIFKIGDSKSLSIPKAATVIDGTGNYLLPGLADMHVHFGLREWETPDANLYLANGVTTIRDLTQGGTVGSIKKWCDDFNSKKRLGPTIYNAWTLWGWEPHAAETVPLAKANGYDCLKINSYFTRAEFFDIVTRAKAAGIYTIGHVPWPLSMDDVIASGMNELSHVELLPIMLIDDPQFEPLPKNKWDEEMLTRMFALLTPAHEDATGKELEKIKERLAGMIAKMKGKGVTVTTTLVCDEVIALTYNDLYEIVHRPGSMYLSPRYWDDLMKGKEKNAYFRGKEWGAQLFYDLIVFSLGEMRKNGIPIVAGTDSGPSFVAEAPGFALHDELRAIVAGGYTPYEALAAATRDASKVVARMTGRDEFGTVEEGKRADLLLLADNPLENVAAARTPLGVMTAGKWLTRPELERLLQVKRILVTPILREVWKKTNSVDAVIAEYKKACSENYLNDYYMAEGVLTRLGYDFLNLGKIDEAIAIFKLNCEEYRYSANVYDSLGEAYLKKGDKASAIETYRKALSLDPGFESSLKALQELEKQR